MLSVFIFGGFPSLAASNRAGGIESGVHQPLPPTGEGDPQDALIYLPAVRSAGGAPGPTPTPTRQATPAPTSTPTRVPPNGVCFLLEFGNSGENTETCLDGRTLQVVQAAGSFSAGLSKEPFLSETYTIETNVTVTDPDTLIHILFDAVEAQVGSVDLTVISVLEINPRANAVGFGNYEVIGSQWRIFCCAGLPLPEPLNPVGMPNRVRVEREADGTTVIINGVALPGKVLSAFPGALRTWGFAVKNGIPPGEKTTVTFAELLFEVGP